jgi:hypothetical protein
VIEIYLWDLTNQKYHGKEESKKFEKMLKKCPNRENLVF